MKKYYSHFMINLFFFFVSIGFAISCMPASDPDSRDNPEVDVLSEDERSTLGSLELVDPYPLYTMRYDADYDFNGYTPGIVFSADRIVAGSGFDFCSCFTAFGDDSAPLFGRNFDFYHRPALLLFTSPAGGFRSASMVDLYDCGITPESPLAEIEDRIGLLDAPYLPIDGINECGVTIGLMAVPHAEPPHDPNKPDVHELGMIRMVLDCATDAEHAVSLIQGVNVVFTHIPLHYLIGDPSGRSVVVEFVEHAVRVIWNEHPYQVSTNFTQSYYLPDLHAVCLRYDRLNADLTSTNGLISMEEGMDLLSKVSQPHTMWSMVYHMKSGRIMAVMGRNYKQIHIFDFPLGPDVSGAGKNH